MSVFCYYMFYKNIANVLAMYWYTFLALASGERLFLALYIEFYNILYTSMPIIIFGIFDQDVSKQVSSRSPHLYSAGINRTLFTRTGFMRWVLEATVLALHVTFVPALGLGLPGLSLASPQDGDPSVDALSFNSMALICVCTNLRLALELHSWGALELAAMWGSLIALELSLLLWSYATYSDSLPATYDWSGLYDMVPAMYSTAAYWLVVLLVLSLTLLPRIAGKGYTLFELGRLVSAVAQSQAGGLVRAWCPGIGGGGEKREDQRSLRSADEAAVEMVLPRGGRVKIGNSSPGGRSTLPPAAPPPATSHPLRGLQAGSSADCVGQLRTLGVGASTSQSRSASHSPSVDGGRGRPASRSVISINEAAAAHVCASFTRMSISCSCASSDSDAVGRRSSRASMSPAPGASPAGVGVTWAVSERGSSETDGRFTGRSSVCTTGSSRYTGGSSSS